MRFPMSDTYSRAGLGGPFGKTLGKTEEAEALRKSDLAWELEPVGSIGWSLPGLGELRRRIETKSPVKRFGV